MTSTLLWSLIAVQIALGALDTLVHHELLERLAWRPSQARELTLHGTRNLIYAAVFLALGWTEPHGAWALALVAALLGEIGVTLADFAEEDRTRRLSPSERALHAVMAINYGAVLALGVPVLVRWATLPTGAAAVSHGVWSVLASAAAMAVALFGLRDLAAAKRAPRLASPPAAPLAAALPGRWRILVTGATGFIGWRLVEALAGSGHEVIALVRDPARAAVLLPAPVTLVTDLRQIAADTPIDAVVNLAGEPLSDGLWTAAKRRAILRSRLRVTREVVRLAARLDRPPRVLVSGSAVGWYGLRGDEPLNELSDPVRGSFSHRLCAAWERAATRAERLGVRVVRLRTGLVLGTQGGMLSRLLVPFEFGLGGPLGSGRQWAAWIERDDCVRLIVHALVRPELSGALNAVAPEPVRQGEFARALGRALGRPALLPAPAALLRMAGGLGEELLLGGQRVYPARALTSGFRFQHSRLPDALAAILGAAPARPAVASVRVAAQHPRTA